MARCHIRRCTRQSGSAARGRSARSVTGSRPERWAGRKELLAEGVVENYAELARLGYVSRARVATRICWSQTAGVLTYGVLRPRAS